MGETQGLRRVLPLVIGSQEQPSCREANKLWEILQSGGLRKADVAAVIGALLYLISPFDLIADFIPVIGLLDDLFVVSSMLRYLGRKPA